MDLDVKHLRLVAGIADCGSMTSAASRLHLTQSALSHQLREIEARFNTPFFLRVGRRMVLTAAGRRVLESARRILDDLVRRKKTSGFLPETRPASFACAPSATPDISGCRRCSRRSTASTPASASTSLRTRPTSRWRRCSRGGSTSPFSRRR